MFLYFAPLPVAVQKELLHCVCILSCFTIELVALCIPSGFFCIQAAAFMICHKSSTLVPFWSESKSLLWILLDWLRRMARLALLFTRPYFLWIFLLGIHEGTGLSRVIAGKRWAVLAYNGKWFSCMNNPEDIWKAGSHFEHQLS